MVVGRRWSSTGRLSGQGCMGLTTERAQGAHPTWTPQPHRDRVVPGPREGVEPVSMETMVASPPVPMEGKGVTM